MNDHIQVTFGADTSKVNRALRGIRGTVSDFANDVKKSFASWGSGLIAVGTLSALGKKVIDVSESLNDLSEMTGTSTTFIQGWQQSVIQGTGSIEEADKALEKFNTKIGDCARDSALAAKSFGRYGIAVKDSNGRLRGTEDILGDVAQLIKETGTQAERASIAADMFGDKLGPKLAASLAEGREAIKAMQKESPFKISEENLADIKMYSDSIKGADSGITALAANFAMKLAKPITVPFKILGSQMAENLSPGQRLLGILNAMGYGVAKIKAASPLKIVTSEVVQHSDALLKNLMGIRKNAFDSLDTEDKLNVLQREREALATKLSEQIPGTIQFQQVLLDYVAKEAELRKLNLVYLDEQKNKLREAKDAQDALNRSKEQMDQAQKDRTRLSPDELRNTVSSGLSGDRGKLAQAEGLQQQADQLSSEGDFAGAEKLLQQRDVIVQGDPNSAEAKKSLQAIAKVKRNTSNALYPHGNRTVLEKMEKDHKDKFGGIDSLKDQHKGDDFTKLRDAMSEALLKHEENLRAKPMPIIPHNG